MTRRNRASSSSLFLMELIIAIFFFSAASAVCIQFFVKSHLLSAKSNALNHAVNECTSTAELIDASEGIDGSLNMLMRLYPNGTYPDTRLSSLADSDADVRIYFDKDFQDCISQDAAYILTIHFAREEWMISTDMKVTSADGSQDTENIDDEVIYELQTRHHIARRTEYEKE